MKKIIFLALSVNAFLFCQGQNIKYKVLDVPKFDYNDVLLKTDDGFIKVEVESKTQLFLNQANLERMRKRVSLIKLDETCAPLKSVELFGGEPKLIPGAYKIFQFGKKYCIAYQESKGSDTYTNVKLLSINPQQLTVEKEITAIDFDKYGISFNAKEVLKNNTFMYSSEVSQLGKRVLFYSEIEGSSKSGGVKAILRVVDENFKTVMDKTIEFKEKYVYTYSYSCDDEGNVYIIYWGGEDKMKYKNGNTVYQDRHIMVLRADNGQVIDLPYKLEDNYMTNHRMVYSPKEDKLYVMALYGKGMDENYLGVRYTRIDRKLWKMEPFVNVEFPKEIVDQFDRDGFASTKQKKYGLSNSFGGNPIVRGDGTVDFALLYIRREDPIRDGRSYQAVNFYAGNILDMHWIDGEVVFTRIPRDIVSPGIVAYLYYIPYSHNENLLFLYNDSKKNIEQSFESKPHNSIVQKSEVCVITVSKDGKLKREMCRLPLFSTN